jgi:hypothetical protein
LAFVATRRAGFPGVAGAPRRRGMIFCGNADV